MKTPDTSIPPFLYNQTAKIDGMEEGKSYPERLKALGMLSQERRRERNIIVFLWKVSQGLVKGYKASFNYNERRGNLMILAPLKNSAPATVKKAREASLQVRGAKLFNLIPKELRDGFISVDKFKADLDDWLKSIPDEPTSAGRQRAAESNARIQTKPSLASCLVYIIISLAINK